MVSLLVKPFSPQLRHTLAERTRLLRVSVDRSCGLGRLAGLSPLVSLALAWPERLAVAQRWQTEEYPLFRASGVEEPDVAAVAVVAAARFAVVAAGVAAIWRLAPAHLLLIVVTWAVFPVFAVWLLLLSICED